MLQVVTGSTDNETLTSSSTYADTTLTANITPVHTSNKVMVLANIGGCSKNTSTTWMGLRLLRDATTINETKRIAQTPYSEVCGVGATSLNELDSPSTTSAITYKVQFMSSSDTASVAVQNHSSESNIMLLEIDGT